MSGHIFDILSTPVASYEWVLYVLFGLVLVAVLVLPRKFAKRSQILGNPGEKLSAHQELRRSMDRLLVQLHETAREINATLDTKMVALAKLIEQADRRIETLGKSDTGTAKAPPAEVEDEPTVEEETPETGTESDRAQLEREIYRLADEGKNELEIARLTQTPRGEVELILGLRGKHHHDTTTEDGNAS